MRCLSCNKNLSDYEATRRYAHSGDFVDLCNKCFHPISKEVNTIERADLATAEDLEEYDEEAHCGLDVDKDF